MRRNECWGKERGEMLLFRDVLCNKKGHGHFLIDDMIDFDSIISKCGIDEWKMVRWSGKWVMERRRAGDEDVEISCAAVYDTTMAL